MKIKGCTTGVVFYCPACKRRHVAYREGWKWNGDTERPTIEPSLVMTWNKPGNATYIPGLPTEVCHVVVRDGQLIYHKECTHEFRERTVPMVDLPTDG